MKNTPNTSRKSVKAGANDAKQAAQGKAKKPDATKVMPTKAQMKNC